MKTSCKFLGIIKNNLKAVLGMLATILMVTGELRLALAPPNKCANSMSQVNFSNSDIYASTIYNYVQFSVNWQSTRKHCIMACWQHFTAKSLSEILICYVKATLASFKLVVLNWRVRTKSKYKDQPFLTMLRKMKNYSIYWLPTVNQFCQKWSNVSTSSIR